MKRLCWFWFWCRVADKDSRASSKSSGCMYVFCSNFQQAREGEGHGSVCECQDALHQAGRKLKLKLKRVGNEIVAAQHHAANEYNQSMYVCT